MPVRCLTCDKLLTGKQRKFCSDACRQRHDRLTANNPDMTANQPVTSLNDRKLTAFDRESTAIVVIMVIKYNDHGLTHESDAYAVKSLFAREIQQAALQSLRGLFYDWEFKIKSIDVRKQ